MKSWIVIIMGLLVYACKEDKPKVIMPIEKIIIPSILVSKRSQDCKLKNDTVFLNNKQFEGYVYDLYPNLKDTFSVEGFSNGVLHGITKKWFPNGQLMEERWYYKGEKNGKQIAYWDNGNKRFEFIAEKDYYQGELKEWTVDGKLFHLGTYVNGQEEGKQQLWYDNGKIRANYVIIKGKRYGLLGTKNCKNVSDSVFIVK